MSLLFAGRSRHIEFIGAATDLRCTMFQHLFDPSSIVAFRLLVVLAQAGGAVVVLTVIFAVRRWIVRPVVRLVRGKGREIREVVS
jgi:nitrate/nitrite-specific signal transduction histidine kinase